MRRRWALKVGDGSILDAVTKRLNALHCVSMTTSPTHDDTNQQMSWQTIYRRKQGELTAAEKRTGDYFASHPQSAYMSITELVEESGLGYGTIIRFCQKMGFRGFQAFKLALARDGAANANAANTGSDVGNRLRNDVLETLRLIDDEALEKAVSRLLKSKTILIVGVASSAPLVLSLAWKLKRIGINARAVTEGYMMAVDAFLLSKKDLLVAISSSGATKDILHTVEVASSRGASILALTNFSSSPLSERSDIALFTSASRDPLKAEVPSMVCGEVMIEVLLDRLLRAAPERQEHLLESSKAVSDRKV